MGETLKPRRTLGFKLLLGTTLIVLLLMSSAFYLAYTFLSEETSTFTFESQSNQSQLLGQRFSGVVETVTNTLKILPALDERTKNALENQDKIRGLEVFAFESASSTPKRIFEWGKGMPKEKPSKKIVDEVLKSGVAYEPFKDDSGNTDVYLFSLTENPAGGGFAVSRAKLNLDELTKKSAGVHARVVNKDGLILLDTKNPESIGTQTDSADPLFKAANKSPISLGTLEYLSREGGEKHLGTYVIPGYNAVILNTIRYKDAMKGTYMLLEKMLLVGLALLGGSLIVTVFFSIRLTRPLEHLTAATNVIAAGNFDLDLQESTSDEIGILSRSMNSMSRKIKELLLESIAKVKIEQEVAIASTLQQNLIPPTSIEKPHFGLESHYQSAQQCGGDWWGYVETPSSLTIMISDATGHGLPPAMLTAAAHGCFSALQKLLSELPDLSMTPKLLLQVANQVIVDSAKSELNMTMFVATFDFKAKTLTYSNAGHNAPWILRSGDSSKFEALKARGSRLGETTGFTPSENVTIPFGESDILFLYTDGLIENKGKTGSEMSKEEIRGKLASLAPKGIRAMSEEFSTELNGFYDGVVPDDDVTYVLFKRNNGMTAEA
ncbi:MAG: HAMP domain-containing protein [Proteobacteria bacterium]|nr:HAMP domain-containing protein [Pseudomonadota bacterium]